MAQLSEIRRLQEQRRQLVAESDRLRARCAGHVRHVNDSLAWVEKGYAVVRQLRPFWPVIAGMGGLLLARRRGSRLRLFSKLMSGWRFARTLRGVWRTFSPAGTGER